MKKIARRVFSGLIVVSMALSALAFVHVTPARADGNAPPPTPPGLLSPGTDRYYAVLDVASIPDSAQCDTHASSGAFAYYGPGLNLAGGANGFLTGFYNARVCGNRQGNLP